MKKKQRRTWIFFLIHMDFLIPLKRPFSVEVYKLLYFSTHRSGHPNDQMSSMKLPYTPRD